MSPYHFSRELEYTRKMAIKALSDVPTNSFYRNWIYALIREELEAPKFKKLQNKLKKYWGEEWAL